MKITHTVNGVDLDRLFETIEHIDGDPRLARFQFRVGNRWISGGHSRTRIKGFHGAGREDMTRTETFVVDADEPAVLLGGNRAPSPPEYVLHALAACLAGTLAYHAAARGIAIQGLACTVEGDLDLQGFLGMDESVRPGYENIRAVFNVSGDFDEDGLLELASLMRHSPVRDIISNPVPVTIDLNRA